MIWCQGYVNETFAELREALWVDQLQRVKARFRLPFASQVCAPVFMPIDGVVTPICLV